MELRNDLLLNHLRLWLAANGGPNYPTNDSLLDDKPGGNAFYRDWVLAHGNNLPAPPVTPMEFHPYLIPHPVDLNCEKLIIGTLPPISYLCDALGINPIINPNGNNITSPTIPFFYGNELSLWKFAADQILHDAIQEFNAGVVNRHQLLGEVQAFLDRNEATVSDIIRSAQREQINANDSGLHNLELNLQLPASLCSPQSRIRTLIFTSSQTAGVNGLSVRVNDYQDFVAGDVNIQNRDAFSLFVRTCQLANIQVNIQLWGPPPQPWMTVNLYNADWFAIHTQNKILFRMRLYHPVNGDRLFSEFNVLAGPSPSSNARRGLANNANRANHGGNVNAYRTDFYHNAIVTNNHGLINTWQ